MAAPNPLEGTLALRVESETGANFDAVPYHAWNDRGLAPMNVWLPLEPVA